MKKAVLANELTEQSQVENPNRHTKRQWIELGRCNVAAEGERH